MLVPPISGIGRYTQNLLKWLMNFQEDDSKAIETIKVFTPLNIYQESSLGELLIMLDGDPSQNEQVRSINRLKRIKSFAKQIPGGDSLKRAVQQRLLRQKIKACKGSIYWEPNYILEEFDGVSISTIYDLSHIRYPKFHPKERRRWLDDNLKKTLDNGSGVVTISEFSKNEIIEYYSVNDEDITIIPPAVSDEFRQVYTDDKIESVRCKYQLPKSYILSVGTIEPRKNLVGLLAAFALLPNGLKESCPLVVVGCEGWLSEDVEEMLRPMMKKKQVIRLGYVSQMDLPVIFSGASLFVYISHYEGYGMPVAEAMCSGVPVLTSNVSSMPEVAANCATLVNPEDIKLIAQEIEELIENSAKRRDQIHRAKKQSDGYIWEESAQKLVELFQRHNP